MKKQFFFGLLAGMLCTSLHASGPTVDTIDYANPKKYIRIENTLGTKSAILAQAKELKGDTDLSTIRNVLGWMQQNLKCDNDIAYAWRNYDDVLRDKTYGGCADQGIVCGVLLKGAGIPTVWVKTMDVSWIWDFKKDRPFTSWVGHVFLEVFINNQWMLLDPGGQTLYKEYSPKARILPGNRFAYHKGNDPKKMILSLQWEAWKDQTKKYFRELDTSLLPVDLHDTLTISRRAYVIGNSPHYQVMTELVKESGIHSILSFNTKYDIYLPQARGHLLFVETHAGEPIITVKNLERYFPGVAECLDQPGQSIIIKGTKIVFLEVDEQRDVLKKAIRIACQ